MVARITPVLDPAYKQTSEYRGYTEYLQDLLMAAVNRVSVYDDDVVYWYLIQ
jgi:hypothetical protein